MRAPNIRVITHQSFSRSNVVSLFGLVDSKRPSFAGISGRAARVLFGLGVKQGAGSDSDGRRRGASGSKAGVTASNEPLL